VDWVVVFSKLRQKLVKLSTLDAQCSTPLNHIVQHHQRDKLRKKFLIKAYNCREKSKLLQDQLQDIFVGILDQKSGARNGTKTPAQPSWKEMQASRAAMSAQAKAARSNPNMFDSIAPLRVFCAHLRRFRTRRNTIDRIHTKRRRDETRQDQISSHDMYFKLW
jgi:hypothetical protein